jgi:hypothetical protein
MGVDARWEHTIVVFNAAGDIVESWTQWDKMMRRPHSVYSQSVGSGEARLDRRRPRLRPVYQFTHDGKQIVITLGTPNKRGNDSSHFEPADVPGVPARQQRVCL